MDIAKVATPYILYPIYKDENLSGKETKVSSFARLKCTPLRSGLAEIHLPFFMFQVRKASKLSYQQFWREGR